MRTFSILACLVCLWCLLTQAAFADLPDGITCDYSVGYNNFVQASRINTVIVELENNSPDTNVSGDLVLEYNGVEYSTPLELPTPSKKRFYLYVPLDNYRNQVMTLRIRSRSFTQSYDIVLTDHVLDPEDINVVVLTKDTGSLQVVNELAMVRVFRDLYSYKSAELGSAEVRTSYFELSEIDHNPKFFSCADIIVLSDVDYQQVTPDLADALKAAVSGGKSIVFCLGANGTAVTNSPLNDLCPLSITGTTQVDDLGRFGQRYNITPADGTAILAVGQSKLGTEVTGWAGSYPIVARRRCGSGYVTAFAFDFNARPFKLHPSLASIFIDHVFRVSDTIAVTDWFIHPMNISHMLQNLSEAKPMRPGFVFLFLLAYVILIGPLNFLVLGRLKRRTLVWITIPVFIAAFSYIGLSTGYFYRGSNNVVATFQELHVYPEAEFTPYQSVMLIFTAEQTRYELKLPDRSAFAYPDIPQVLEQSYFGQQTNPRAIRGLSNSRLDNSASPRINTSQGKWTSKEYIFHGYKGLETNVESNITAHVNAGNISDIKGEFTIDLPFDLYNCRLIGAGSTNLGIGNIRGQGTYQLSNISTFNGGLPVDNYLADLTGEFLGMQVSSSRDSLQYTDELLLVGFTPNIEVQAEFSNSHLAHDLSMVVIHLPFEHQPRPTEEPRVIGRFLDGGVDFEAYEQYNYNYYQDFASQRDYYVVRAGGYIDIAYRLDGDLTRTRQAYFRLDAYDIRMQENKPDLINLVNVYYFDGVKWQPVPIPQSSPKSFDIAGLSSILRDKDVFKLRLQVNEDMGIKIPDMELYGN